MRRLPAIYKIFVKNWTKLEKNVFSLFIYNIKEKGAKNMDFLTLEDLAKELGRSENTLRVHFDRTKEN